MNTEHLSGRLQAIAERVDIRRNAADIGCDHGKLALNLLQRGCPRVIVSDISAPCVDKARRLLRSRGRLNEADVRVGDGLSTLKAEDDIGTVIIAGMGGNVMVHILQEGAAALEQVDTLLLQPQSELPRVREWLRGQGFGLQTEQVLWDAGHYYHLMVAKRGIEDLLPQNWLEEEFGVLPLREKSEALLGCVREHENKLKASLGRIGEADSPRAREQAEMLRAKIRDCEEFLYGDTGC